MDQHFIPINNGAHIELFIFTLFFIGITIVRVSNPKHIPYILGFHYLKTSKRKQDFLVFGKNDSKSSVFLNFFYVVFLSLLIQKLFNLEYLQAFLVGTSLFTVQLLGWLVVQQFLSTKSEISFLKSRFLMNETVAFLFFFYLILHQYVPHNIIIGYIFSSLIFVFALIRVSGILTNYISVFHNILYLCALEILPVLVMVKLVTKHII